MAEQVLHAEIRAEATGGETIERVKREVADLQRNLEHLHREERRGSALLGRLAESFAFAGEHSERLREGAIGLREALGENGETLGELIPMLGAFGAAASVTGLADMMRESAEARTQLNAMAVTLGVTTGQLQALQLAARETDVPVETMQTGMVRLARAIADAASGRNKEAAQIFGRMGIGLRDANGHLRTGAEVLPLVAESIRRTGDATLRTAVAMQLFGRGGAALIPLLTEGKSGLDELAETSERLNATFSPEQNEGVERFKNSWIELDTAFGGLRDTITADLAPALTPVVNAMTDWIAANREWLGQNIAGDFRTAGDELRKVPWTTIAHDAGAVGHVLNEGAHAMGGWVRIGEVFAGLAVLKLAWSAAQPLIEIGRIGIGVAELTANLAALALGWKGVEKAAEKAGAAEEVAAHVRPGLAAERPAVAVAKEGASRAARLAKSVPLLATAIEFGSDAAPLMHYVAHLDGTVDNTTGGGRNYAGAGHGDAHADTGVARGRNAARGTAGAHGPDPFDQAESGLAEMFAWLRGLHERSYATAAERDGEVKVTVQLANAPPGTTATVSQSGAVRADPVDVGHSHPMGYPR